ncbi:MAG: Mth938-like domain-containing protein [Burkholderiales bacterium]
MKLHLSNAPGRNTVTAYGADYVDVNGQRHQTSLVVGPTQLDTAWTPGPDNRISVDSIRLLASFEAEIVLIGTGSEQRFPDPVTLRPLIDAGVGFEIMSTPAACRTYNILVAEDRQVVAALIL